MVKRIWALLTGGNPVYLMDYDGEVTLTIARRNKFGTVTAKRWWPSKIRLVTLLPDGTVDDVYVRKWKAA